MALARDCPLCTCTRARPVWREAERRYVRCSNCGVVFSDLDADTYATEEHNAWHDEQLDRPTELFYGRARALVHARFLERFPPCGSSRLLDVGCGLGYFVQRASQAGWKAHGCDTSSAWIAHARSLVEPERIALSPVTESLFGGGFDLVTTWDVLEHIYEPLPFLRTIASLLAPGGRAFIRTPNLTWVYPTYGLRRHVLRSPVELGPLNHVVYYTAATLTVALRRADLRPASWPVLPPPQVPLSNRDPSQAGVSSTTTRLKNIHAGAAERIAALSRGRIVVGSDLDVVAVRANSDARAERSDIPGGPSNSRPPSGLKDFEDEPNTV
ncbi:MAG: class I SAM-dependent methyltransferase [Solirubrobacteraceae bacterium]